MYVNPLQSLLKSHSCLWFHNIPLKLVLCYKISFTTLFLLFMTVWRMERKWSSEWHLHGFCEGIPLFLGEFTFSLFFFLHRSYYVVVVPIEHTSSTLASRVNSPDEMELDQVWEERNMLLFSDFLVERWICNPLNQVCPTCGPLATCSPSNAVPQDNKNIFKRKFVTYMH